MTNQTVIEKIKELATSKDWEVIAIRKVSENPMDNYLSYVLCKRNSMGDYCTHLCNHEDLDNVYFAMGHYDFETHESALEDFKTRG